MGKNSPAGNAFVVMFILMASAGAATALCFIAVVKSMPLDYIAVSVGVWAVLVLLTWLAGMRYVRLQRQQDEEEAEWFNSRR